MVRLATRKRAKDLKRRLNSFPGNSKTSFKKKKEIKNEREKIRKRQAKRQKEEGNDAVKGKRKKVRKNKK